MNKTIWCLNLVEYGYRIVVTKADAEQATRLTDKVKVEQWLRPTPPPAVVRLQQQITVCDKCFRVCCWHGILMCREAYEAGVVEKTVLELILLNVEHPSYYTTE